MERISTSRRARYSRIGTSRKRTRPRDVCASDRPKVRAKSRRISMIYTDLAPSSPLWRGRPRHSRPRTYPSSSTRVLSVGTSPSRLSLLVSPSPLLPPCSLRCQSLFRHPRARFARALRFLSLLLVFLPPSSSSRQGYVVLGLAAVRRRERKRSIWTEVKL